MAWITPKTDWSAAYDQSGSYIGDYFNYVDYNRIRNNLEEVTTLAQSLFILNLTTSLSGEATVNGYPYAGIINAWETRLDEINQQTYKADIGQKKTFYDNGAFLDADELNRIERSLDMIYQMLKTQYGGRRRLRFTLGFHPKEVF